MTEPKDRSNGAIVPTNAAELVSGAVGKISSVEGMTALKQVVAVVQETIKLHETESTKREQLKTYRQTQVARLKLVENTLGRYFDLVFPERHETNKRLFENLDVAVKSGDVAAMQAVVAGIVQVAQTSPLKDLGNLTELVKAMDDPDAVFEL